LAIEKSTEANIEALKTAAEDAKAMISTFRATQEQKGFDVHNSFGASFAVKL